MRALPVLLALVVLAPGGALAAEGDERDRAAEVRDGAEVHMHLQYDASTQVQYAGSSEDGYYSVRYSGGQDVSWSGTLLLRHQGADGKLEGSLFGEWIARASKDRAWKAENEHSRFTEDTVCFGGDRQEFALNVEASPEAEGLRVRILGYVVPNFALPSGCHTKTVDVRLGETETREHDGPWEHNVVLLHALGGTSYDADVSLLVPYDAAATKTFTHRAAVPTTGDAVAGVYCQGTDPQEWISGTCVTSGTLRVRNLVDPCPWLRRVAPDHHAALASLAPPPADEAAIRAWSLEAQRLIGVVLGDHRAWQLLGCDGDLSPDPWDAIHRALKLKRDALLQLLKDGKLSREGVSELLGAERALQLTGAADDGANVVGAIEAANAPPAQRQGNVEVRVHSPVSLHVYDERGGHVGWVEARNASEATIEGATYEGAPGGAQTIVLPAGYYEIVVDELDHGGYLLEVETNGTGADAQEAVIVESRPDRTTLTHVAVTQGWEGARLDAFPVRRGPTTDAAPAFLPEGRPSTTSGSPEGTDDEDVAGGSDEDEGEGTNGAPFPGTGIVLALGLALALALRGRNKHRPRS